jgi:hypothetical protein
VKPGPGLAGGGAIVGNEFKDVLDHVLFFALKPLLGGVTVENAGLGVEKSPLRVAEDGAVYGDGCKGGKNVLDEGGGGGGEV